MSKGNVLPTILAIGLNHTTAPIATREKAAWFKGTSGDRDGRDIRLGALECVDTYVVVETCNRTEIYAVTADATEAMSGIRELFRSELSGHATAELLYEYRDRAAVSHLFAVASGIDSLVLGEFEILGQVRDAYRSAASENHAGPILHALFQAALHVGKRARSETDIGHAAHSVSTAALALARAELGSGRGRIALVIGAGTMGRRAAENLSRDGDWHVVVTNRTFSRAMMLAQRLGARAVPFERLDHVLSQVDLVVSATSAAKYLVTAETLVRAMAARPTRPLCILDVAIPRNIEPDVSSLWGIRLLDLDDLQSVLGQTEKTRSHAVEMVHSIISDEVESFWQWYRARRAAAFLGELYDWAENVRIAELNKTLQRLGHLSLTDREEAIVSALSVRLVSKLVAMPTANLKARMANGGDQSYLDAVRELYDLKVEPGDKERW